MWREGLLPHLVEVQGQLQAQKGEPGLAERAPPPNRVRPARRAAAGCAPPALAAHSSALLRLPVTPRPSLLLLPLPAAGWVGAETHGRVAQHVEGVAHRVVAQRLGAGAPVCIEQPARARQPRIRAHATRTHLRSAV